MSLAVELAPSEAAVLPQAEPAVSELATRFARTGAGRDWLHTFARNRVGRVCLIIQAAVYLLSAVLILIGVGDTPSYPRRAAVLAAAAVLHLGASWVAWRYGLLELREAHCGAYVADHSLWRRLAVAGVILLSAGVIVVDLSARQPDGQFNVVIAHLLVAVTVMFTSAVFSPLFTAKTVGIVPLALAGLTALSQTVAGMPAQPDLWVASFMVAYLLVLKLRLSKWHEKLWAEWEADLDLLAALAATEERLSLSRDIHDATGQTLTAIAMKAELARKLFERGEAAAIKEAREVSHLAREALVETRALVTGFRQTDLRNEIVNARTLMDSLGIPLRVTGNTTGWPQDVLGAFGWVLREAITNINRHAKPGFVTVELRRDEREVRMSIAHDGVYAADSQPDAERRLGGSGLPGLRERVARVGGSLTVNPLGDTFELVATAPIPKEEL